MEFNWSIVGWIAALLFVYLFGLFEGRGQGYKKRKKEEEQQKEPAAPTPVSPRTIPLDDPGLLRIRNEGGSIVLDLDGSRVNSGALTPGQRRRLIELLNIIRPWLEARPAPAPASSPRPTAPPPPLQPATLDDRLQAIGSSPAPRPPVPPAASTPRPPTLAREDRPAAPAGSIVGQIDAILQEQLEGTPLGERGIFLAQSAEGGVSVYVGLTRYPAIDDVPDPEIRAAIRAAIAAWENKYTPGL